VALTRTPSASCRASPHRHACACGNVAFDAEVRHAPMLRDEAWAKIAGPYENLCTKCFFAGAQERGVRLTLAMLKPCLVNLFHRPLSWFDAFTRALGDPPVDIEAWLKAERDLRKINADASRPESRPCRDSSSTWGDEVRDE
jgi:hypothetical protein